MLHARMLTCSFVFAAGVLASAFAMQTDEKNRQILGMLSSLAKQDKKKNETLFLYQVKVCHVGFLKKVSLFFLRPFQEI